MFSSAPTKPIQPCRCHFEPPLEEHLTGLAEDHKAGLSRHHVFDSLNRERRISNLRAKTIKVSHRCINIEHIVLTAKYVELNVYMVTRESRV